MSIITNEDVTLIEATKDDFEFYYNLKCEPDNIYWGGFACKPNYKNIKDWYYSILLDDTKKNFIIKYNNKEVGYVSFKIYNNLICDDFSIAVSNRFSGKGIATKAINKVIEYLKNYYLSCKVFHSYIRVDNVPSQKVHKRNGFDLTNEYEDRFLQSDNMVIRLQKWTKKL